VRILSSTPLGLRRPLLLFSDQISATIISILFPKLGSDWSRRSYCQAGQYFLISHGYPPYHRFARDFGLVRRAYRNLK